MKNESRRKFLEEKEKMTDQIEKELKIQEIKSKEKRQEKHKKLKYFDKNYQKELKEMMSDTYNKGL